jgi:DNA repair photolyase
LNRTWGDDLRPADPDEIRQKLINGLKNTNPKTSLAWALKHKKTLRLGNKTDPYQMAELEHRVSRRIQRILVELEWSYVIQTRFLDNLSEDDRVMAKASQLGILTIMPVITPGAESDREVLERGRTTPIDVRIRLIGEWIARGWNVGVNGEPFIPGYHTFRMFRDILRRLKSVGVRSYNTYNLHMNDHVAKRFVEIGLDLERIWEYNQDEKWRPIQRRLCDIATEEGMILGCPDFVNVNPDWRARSNTCCGITVPNPSKYNAHHWRHLVQKGMDKDDVLKNTWEGIGDKAQGETVVRGGTKCDFFTLTDAGL